MYFLLFFFWGGGELFTQLRPCLVDMPVPKGWLSTLCCLLKITPNTKPGPIKVREKEALSN